MNTSVSYQGLPPEVVNLHSTLGIPVHTWKERKLPFHAQATELVEVDGCDGPYQVCPSTAQAWIVMHEAATAAGLEIFIVSGFRSYSYQAGLLTKKLKAGIEILEALSVIAPPGFSEHHTGQAIDLGTPGSEFLEEDFETTDAFEWLAANAASFGFHMTYPQANPQGFIYEPWHWSFRPK